MGSCYSKAECDACRTENCAIRLEVDNDIVGPGVIAAFLTSAILTLGAVLYGYISGSMPSWYLNEADLIILEAIHRSKLYKGWLYLLRGFWSILGNLLHAMSLKLETYSLSKEQRIEAVSRFVLALSDQQIVTGLAILIGALASRCTITLFELQMVTFLAWFSATTHLATLYYLQEYFLAHPIVRNIRVLFMLALLSLLLCCLVFANALKYNIDIARTPFDCFIRSKLEVQFQDVLFALYFLIFPYISRVQRFFMDREFERPVSLPAWLARQNLWWIYRKKDIGAERRLPQRSISERSEAQAESMARFKFVGSPGESKRPTALDSFRSSYSANLSVMFFALAYGVSGIVWTRFIRPPSFVRSSFGWSFGQFVPLLLLIIPLLMVTEVYFDEPQTSYSKYTQTKSIPEQVISSKEDLLSSISPNTTDEQSRRINHSSEGESSQSSVSLEVLDDHRGLTLTYFVIYNFLGLSMGILYAVHFNYVLNVLLLALLLILVTLSVIAAVASFLRHYDRYQKMLLQGSLTPRSRRRTQYWENLNRVTIHNNDDDVGTIEIAHAPHAPAVATTTNQSVNRSNGSSEMSMTPWISRETEQQQPNWISHRTSMDITESSIQYDNLHREGGPSLSLQESSPEQD